MAPRPGRILIVEDMERWREALRETLAEGHFEVVTAATRSEAFDHLASDLFHLLILDIRLEDQDPSNVEGMEFLRQLTDYGIQDALSVIILTAYGTTEQMREAFRRHGVDDFCAKQQFDESEFLAEVRELFRKRMEINLGLTLHWQGSIDAKAAVLGLRIDDSRVKRETPVQALLARELEDLVCRLFHEADSVLLSPLGEGRSGSSVLLAQPFYTNGGGRSVVVKFGDFRDIEQEHQNYERFIRPYVGGGRSTTVQARRRTPRLGGIVYSFAGDAGGQFVDFATFYQRSDVDAIRRALDRLFTDTCGAWYENPGQRRPLDLTRHYMDWLGMSFDSLRQVLERLKGVQGKEKLYFQSLSEGRPFPNPLLALERTSLVLPTYETITHGDFNEQNILLDDEGHSWLIDFQRTGPGHVLRDAIELDSIIRFTLLQEDEADLDERQRLEEALSVAPISGRGPDLPPDALGDNAAARKAFAVCAHLRSLAGRLVARHTSADVREYQAGSLLCALNTLRFFSLPTLQREHALLSACVLTRRLGL